MSDQVKDPMILFKNTKVGKSTKGDDFITLFLSTEQIQSLAVALTNTKTERGAVITIHTGTKEHNGRSFLSSFAFVRGIQEPRSGGGSYSSGTQDAQDKIGALKSLTD